MILDHLEQNELCVDSIARLWLHQANLNMNLLISKKVLGREATLEEAPVILDSYANTSSAGSVIAFHKHKQDLPTGAMGALFFWCWVFRWLCHIAQNVTGLICKHGMRF